MFSLASCSDTWFAKSSPHTISSSLSQNSLWVEVSVFSSFTLSSPQRKPLAPTRERPRGGAETRASLFLQSAPPRCFGASRPTYREFHRSPTGPSRPRPIFGLLVGGGQTRGSRLDCDNPGFDQEGRHEITQLSSSLSLIRGAYCGVSQRALESLDFRTTRSGEEPAGRRDSGCDLPRDRDAHVRVHLLASHGSGSCEEGPRCDHNQCDSRTHSSFL